MAATAPLANGGPGAVDPAVLASRINFHYLTNCVVLENKDRSSVVMWAPASSTDGDLPELQFRLLPGAPTDHGVNVNREMQIPIHGCLGVFRILSGWFVVLITENHFMGTLRDKEIFLASKFQIYPIPTQAVMLEEEKRMQTQFLNNFSSMLNSCGFYYAPEYDLTLSCQQQAHLDLSKPLWERADDRFFWNRHLMEPFMAHQVNDWILPVMDGHIEINNTTSSRAGAYSFALISRRECYRTGARFHTRGADPQGHVANFVETEQILTYNNNVSSWVQTRGSIPLIWFQPRSINIMKNKPTVDFSPFSRDSFRRHISMQVDKYGPHLLVSLIDHKGNEQEVGEAFETEVRMLGHPQVDYLPFDFHEECRNNNYARLGVLVERASEPIRRHRYFLQDHNGRVLLEQQGNVRTNCIDCLDRTNVVQSQFGRLMLKEQMSNLGLMSSDDEFESNLVGMLNHVWTNNADTLSKRYTGVGALKTDFTRTGKRSAKGAMADGVKSVSRLYHSAFNDDTKQDATEFLLGKFTMIRPRDFLLEREGVVRYHVAKKLTWDAKGEECILELDSAAETVRLYSRQAAICKTYPLDNLCQLARYTRNYRGLSMLFNTSAVSKKIEFSRVMDREKFIIRVSRVLRGEVTSTVTAPTPLIDFHPSPSSPSPSSPAAGSPALPPRSHKPPQDKPLQPVRFFVGSINHNASTFHDPPSLEGYIPRDRDVYVVGAQNCNYQVPRDFVFSSAAHWTFSVQQFLGDDFQVVKVATVGSRLVSVVLVRTSLLFQVSNVEVSYTVMNPVKPAPSPPTKSSGFGGFLKTITSEVKKGFVSPDISPTYSESDYMGVALSLTVNETTMCFINTNRCDLPFRVLDFDIATDFHHVFLFGNVSPACIVEDYWVTLFANREFGSVFWRSLLDSNLDGIVGGRQPDVQSPLPVSVCFTLKTLQYLAHQATQKVTITLHDLSASNLEAGDRSMRLFDSLAVVYGPFTAHHAQTNVCPRHVNPSWNEVLRLPAVPTSLGFLEQQFLTVRVNDQEEGLVIGKGIIPLRSAVQSVGQWQEFAIRLSVFDETRGQLRGKISLSLESITSSEKPERQPSPSPNEMPQVDLLSL